jgi:hypothetical protein
MKQILSENHFAKIFSLEIVFIPLEKCSKATEKFRNEKESFAFFVFHRSSFSQEEEFLGTRF